VRSAAFAGAVLTAGLILMGIGWPNLFTLLSLPFLPAPVFFLLIAVRPMALEKRPQLVSYLSWAFLVGAFSWVVQAAWMARGR